MSQKYEKPKNPLQELFELDQPDRDFGLYRVAHAKWHIDMHLELVPEQAKPFLPRSPNLRSSEIDF